MPSIEHEQIITDAVDAICKITAPLFPDAGVIIEACIFNLLFQCKGEGTRGPAADFYILAPDEGGVIFAEVGRMRDGKWKYWTAPDGKPVRVIRIGFDRAASLLHPRHTAFEREIMGVLESF